VDPQARVIVQSNCKCTSLGNTERGGGQVAGSAKTVAVQMVAVNVQARNDFEDIYGLG